MMKDRVKDIVIGLGADLCGVANAEDFKEAPSGFHPLDIFEGCRSVVVLAKRMPKGSARVGPRIVYNRANEMNIFEVDRIAFTAALEMEKLGLTAVPLPADSPYDQWDEDSMRGQGILSMRHAAVLAGLGRLGRNTLVINRELGNMMTIGAILIDLDLESDPRAENLCPEKCRRCLENCPVLALNGVSVDQKRCRLNTYETNARGFGVINCNICRTGCPWALGLKSIDNPDKPAA